MEQFWNGTPVKIALEDGKNNVYEDAFLSFRLENDGVRSARKLAEHIGRLRGEGVGKEAFEDFQQRVNKVRGRSEVAD